MEQTYKLGKIDEIIEQREDLAEIPYDIMEQDENYQILINPWCVHIPELELNLHSGVFCNYDEHEKDYLDDFALTVIKDARADCPKTNITATQ
jgi:hypothetical protein